VSGIAKAQRKRRRTGRGEGATLQQIQ